MKLGMVCGIGLPLLMLFGVSCRLMVYDLHPIRLVLKHIKESSKYSYIMLYHVMSCYVMFYL